MHKVSHQIVYGLGLPVYLICCNSPMQVTPVIDEANLLNVHHFLIYECKSLNSTHIGYSAPCSTDGVTGAMVSACRAGGSTLLAGWAVGGGVSWCLVYNMQLFCVGIIFIVACIYRVIHRILAGTNIRQLLHGAQDKLTTNLLYNCSDI